MSLAEVNRVIGDRRSLGNALARLKWSSRVTVRRRLKVPSNFKRLLKAVCCYCRVSCCPNFKFPTAAEVKRDSGKSWVTNDLIEEDLNRSRTYK